MKQKISSLIFFLLVLAIIKSEAQCVTGEHFWTGLTEGRTLYKNPTCFHPEGVVFSWASKNGVGLVRLYRFYNSETGLHFYSQSTEEGIKAGYKLEGVCGYVAQTNLTNTIPVYRFYNASNSMHFFSTDVNGEVALKMGYVRDGIAFYAWRRGEQDVNVIRFHCTSPTPTNLTPQDEAAWANITGGTPVTHPDCKNLGKITLYNPSGSNKTVYIYGVLTKPGNPTFDFCASSMIINAIQLNDGTSYTYIIPKDLILNWKTFTQQQCNGDFIQAYGAVYANECCGCSIAVSN